MSGPRQASPPRTSSPARQPGAARGAGGRSAGPARASRAPATGAPAGRAAPRREPRPPGPAPPLGTPGRLSAWQHLLAELDRLLRDPTLTRALKAFAAKVAAGLRALPATILDAARRVARALAAVRLPRRLLLGLLALLLPLALLALLTSSDDRQAARTAPAPTAQPAAAGAGAGLSLPAVGMPELVALPDEVRPVRVALVLDRTYAAPALRRELRVLGGWLAENHAPGTRITVIDAASARASAPQGAARLPGAAAPTRQRTSTAAAIRAALAGGNEAGLVVTLGSTAGAPAPAKALRIATRPGAATGSSAVLARRRRAAVTIDERRPNALAASVARAIMAISGEREKR